MRPARSRRQYNKRYVRPVGEKVEVYEKLREKNKGSGFSYDQIHMWAYILATSAVIGLICRQPNVFSTSLVSGTLRTDLPNDQHAHRPAVGTLTTGTE